MEVKTDDDDRIAPNTKVFVRDSAYAWLPGEVVSPVADADSTASVRLTLPDDWRTYTYAPEHPSLRRVGEVEESTGKVVRTVKLSDYPGKELPLQNVGEDGTTLGKSDMADLPYLHEAAILYNLKDRHKSGVPYTRVGDILVAVNPYQWIDGLYSEKKKHFYAERLVWNAQDEDFSNRQNILGGYFDRITHDPHVYETSAHAYRGLAVDRRDQAILVSGESGAGKTETVKIVMTHLATMEETCGATSPRRGGGGGGVTHAAVVKKIAESNPLFEAFGNAKTARNDNSSRFGKFTKLHFNLEVAAAKAEEAGGRDAVPGCILAGSTFETYLLEKSRVVGHANGERTYHLFYQLLAAPDEEKAVFWDGLRGTSAESFRYVGTPAVDGIEGRSDGEAWAETRDALVDLGFRSGGRLTILMRAVCTVLQLGNLTFGLDPSDDEGSLVTSQGELDRLSELMGVGADDIRFALTTRQITTAGEDITVRLTPTAVKDGCDALAKEIYAQVFQELVGSINESTRPPASASRKEQTGSVSILDMFGFESFTVNRFEQLCINYANERIQHKYVLDTFLSIKEEYESEGIEIYDFSKVDNSDVIRLVEGRTGLIGVLNDECIRPKGNDESFVYKIKTIHRDSRRLVNERLHKPWEFAVRHFAGTVTYDATKFVERNQDQLPKVLLECASQSTNELIRDGFSSVLSVLTKQQSNFRRRRGAATICSKFKSQLSQLMKDIQDARTRYIRCIKPNGEKLPLVMDHDMTMRQLASAGLVTAITVSRESFPNHLRYEVVWDRFHCLLPGGADPGDGTVEDKAKYLLGELLKGKEKVVGGDVIVPFACGKTKVFFRSGSLELLESDRHDLYSATAIILQRWVRAFIAKKRFNVMKASAVVLQAQTRRMIAQKDYEKKRETALQIQCWVRCVLAKKCSRLLRRHRAATIIQSRWKGGGQKEKLLRFKKAADVIKRAIRSRKNQKNFASALATVVEEAQMDRKMKVLQKKLHEPSPYDKDELLKESAMMIEYLSGQLQSYRGRVSDHKAELIKSKNISSTATAHTASIESALAANKLEVSRLTQDNKQLKSQVGECKAGTANLRVLLKNMQLSHDQAKRRQREEYTVMRGSYLKEINSLKKQVRFMKREHATEILKLRHEASVAEEWHRSEILKFQEDFRKSEESHAEDLSNLLNALGTAHEVDASESPYEDEANELKRFIATLRKSNEKVMKELIGNLCENCAPNAAVAMGELELNMDARKL